jgi:hypothetical protein
MLARATPLQMLARDGPCRISSGRPCRRLPASSLLEARPRRPLPELARAGLWPSSPITGGEGDEWVISFFIYLFLLCGE